ncbi:MAG TPA: Asp-tRNA(Asn)/Glu-tRNA(Gln) amidotransferase subunit GatA [Firmicutes bacterium]|jgi:aspartyl-tRNA(Asn)/glutamyl-tRNA(Gln) amidotransferase subunit A|nr:Asp-tRNA(Asn)/Glu-tRNA(Gln) amidotransferase subunit GatA [Bacillota bacterium]HHT43372.1 Asp-tRNA(Asn)/Glu-tRNA(Gln) amidotransferase subunit GatA [Bacillota bacterium]
MRRLAELLQSKQISSTEIVRGCLERIEETEPVLNAFITVDEEGALAQAAAADRRRAAGEPLSPWDGIPLAVKDNISTSGLRTTCASRFLRNYTPIFDATVVERVKRAGLPIVGKTNLDEFAMGSSTEYSAFGVTKNPHDPLRVAGGSSGGSAAAVAAEQVPWSLGTDTGGSIRQPASFCGVVGLKPSYGRVSRYGAVALAPSLDQVGTLARKVEDAAILFSLIAGADPRDAVSAGAPGFPVPVWDDTVVRGLRVGVPEEFFSSGLNEEVEKAVKRALQNLADQGAVLQPISLPTNEYAIDTYLTLVTAEASSCLARFDGVRYGERVEAADANTMFAKSRGAGFGHEVKRRIMLGTYVLSASHYEAYYEQAQKVRTLIKQDVARAFQEVDVIVTPTTPTTAFKIGEKRNPLEMYLSDLYTATANLSGVCALSLPCGVDSQGLPIGLQIIGDHFGEELVFQVAHAVEESVGRGTGSEV